jgi:chorismate-pyruvate lyase
MTTPVLPRSQHARPVEDSWIYPLNEFYALTGLRMPRIEKIDSRQMPQPYGTLLVHDRDMTPTLEQFHRADIHLEILRRKRRGNGYLREVVLRLDGSEQPVEFGANKISLARFSSEAQQLILAARVPLGRILKDFAVPHRTEAEAFLRVESDDLINRAFGLRKATVLYGRKAVISDPQGRPLSEIVEILPPLLNTFAAREQAG